MAAGLFFGLTTVDICSVVPGHPAPNRKLRASRQEVYAGGPAANAAVTFGALGNASHLCSFIGLHPVAALARDDLERQGVAVYDLARDHRELPVISTILIDSSSGDRSVVYRRPPPHEFSETVPADWLLEGISVLLLDGFYLPVALRLAEAARIRGIVTVLDGGSWKDGLECLLPFIDYGVCSADFQPPGCHTPTEVLDYLSDRGVGQPAISRGGKPILLRVGGALEELPVPQVAVVDTLAAGDILHGAFCHHILDHGFRASLQQAAEKASHSCRFFGPRAWQAGNELA